MLLHHALRTESAHEMLPLAHAASEGSDEPAHLHSLAMDIAAHIHIESAYSPTVYNTPTNTATDKNKKCWKKRLVSRLNLYLNLRDDSTQFGIWTEKTFEMIATSSGFALITPFRTCSLLRIGVDQPAHPRSQLATCKNANKKFYHQTCMCGSRGGGGNCF